MIENWHWPTAVMAFVIGCIVDYWLWILSAWWQRRWLENKLKVQER